MLSSSCWNEAGIESMKAFGSHLELDLQLFELGVGLEIKHMYVIIVYTDIQYNTHQYMFPYMYVETSIIHLPTFQIFCKDLPCWI